MCYFPFRTGVYVWVSVPDTIPSLCLSLDSDVVLLCIKKVYIVVYFTVLLSCYITNTPEYKTKIAWVMNTLLMPVSTSFQGT